MLALVVSDALGVEVSSFMLVGAVLGLIAVLSLLKPRVNAPPFISSLPFLGAILSFGVNPKKFLIKSHEEHGEIFSFKMLGKTFTYVIGADASKVFYGWECEHLLRP